MDNPRYIDPKIFIAHVMKEFRCKFPNASITVSSQSLGDTVNQIAVLACFKKIHPKSQLIHFIPRISRRHLNLFSWLPDSVYFFSNLLNESALLDAMDESGVSGDHMRDICFFGYSREYLLTECLRLELVSAWEFFKAQLKVPLDFEAPEIIRRLPNDSGNFFRDSDRYERAVFLIPHSRTVRQPSSAQFLELVGEVSEQGFEIFYDGSCGHTFERGNRVSGSVIDILEIARRIIARGGVVVGVRSGITDVLWQAKIPQILLYPKNHPFLRFDEAYRRKYSYIEYKRGFNFLNAIEQVVFWEETDLKLRAVSDKIREVLSTIQCSK